MQNTKGFTLVELAIVMIIIGLLLGGVLKGQQLIENAKVTSIISQVKGYQAALNSFRDSYGAVPGDMRNATTRLQGCTAANNCNNGNGDSLVGLLGQALTVNAIAEPETIQFWKQMALSDLITGVDPTAGITNNDLAWGSTHPASPIAGGFEFFYTTNLGYSTSTAHVLRLSNGGLSGTGADQPGAGAMSPRTAANIDRKLDDGIPVTGSVMVWDIGNNGCDNLLDGTPNMIDETVTMKSCTVFFLIDG